MIDVGTPDEYGAGHLDGAINADVQSPTVDAEVSALSQQRSCR
ncbi:hypothetical protein [Cryobacterium sp. Y50]|nr:hypothetical protein [Cryobacterium sp. Y50]